MNFLIKLSVKEELKALPIILRNSPGIILPERTYFLRDEAVRKLKEEGLRFQVLSRESDQPTEAGPISGERI